MAKELGTILAEGTGIEITDDNTNITVALTGAAQASLGKADTAVQPAAGVVYVNHGATAATARPVGAAIVYWVGSVEPSNAQNADLWYDTTGD